MPLSATLSPPTLSLSSLNHNHLINHSFISLTISLHFSNPNDSLPNFIAPKPLDETLITPGGGADSFVDDPRNWSRSISSEIDRPYGFEDDDEDDEDGDDDDEEDRSLDLLVRFVQNVFKKVSKRARRAVRSVLPVAIPTK